MQEQTVWQVKQKRGMDGRCAPIADSPVTSLHTWRKCSELNLSEMLLWSFTFVNNV